MSETPAEIPADPPGWAIKLTDNGEYQPVSLVDDRVLDAQPTKAEAVAAIEALD